MSRRLLALVLLLFSLPTLGAGFARLGELSSQGFLIGAQARLLDSGELLGEIAPERQLSPASVTKLYTAAAALDRWGPQHRFTTRLLSTGEVDAEGTLHGDLVFEGGGDPALVSEDLWRLVQRLKSRGLRRVDGRLVISQWRFGPVACTTTDRCRARSRSDNAYSALLSSAGINHGSWCLRVRPAATPATPARVEHCASPAALTPIDSRVNTLLAGEKTGFSAERVTDAEGDRLVLRGNIAGDSAPREIYRSSADPARQTAISLMALLEQAGITVGRGHALSSAAPPASATTLATLESRPLQELLLHTLNYSNNFMADVLSLDLVTTPQATLPQAGQELERFALGLSDHGPVTLKSGSGLTTDNRTSARGVVALLDAMYHRPALFPSFVAGLQSPTNGPMRFIRRGSRVFQDHVMLKTGTLNQPFAVRAVGGYFRTRNGRWGVFSALVNGTAKTPYLSWRTVLEPLAQDLEAMILAH